MIDLTQKVALVTGSSRGIGRACALRLAESGADVVINYLTSATAAREVAEQVKEMGRKAAVVKADVSEPEDVQAMLEFVEAQFGQLDVLVSNVASGGFRTLMETKPSHLQSALSINVQPLLSLVQAAEALLRAGEERGKVVALSSHGSHRALPLYGTIGVSKAALESLVRHLALELGDDINFNVVLAGLVKTDSTQHVPDFLFKQAQEQMMMSRALTAADVADTVLFLCSPLSDLVQAQTLVVDGGADLRG